MIDEETKSLWSQLLGKAMEGDLKGSRLEILPSSLTSWKQWKKSYPETTVIKLRRTSKSFRKDYYRNPERFVIGVTEQSSAKAWRFDLLMQKPLLNDTFQGRSIVIHFSRQTGAAHIYDSDLDGRTLKFELQNGEIRDRSTNSVWDFSTGQAIAGKLRGKSLTPVAAIPSFRKSWQAFYPESQYWKGPGLAPNGN